MHLDFSDGNKLGIKKETVVVFPITNIEDTIETCLIPRQIRYNANNQYVLSHLHTNFVLSIAIA